MKLCLRVDDFGIRPDKHPDTGLELAQHFHEVMAGRPYLGGVVPGILGPDGIRWLQSRPAGLTIALHGWMHDQSLGGVESEFHDLQYWESRKLIRLGCEVLNGLNPVDFIPPWNVLPAYLVAACADEGLSRIWGGPFTAETPPAPGLTHCGWFIPSWLPLYGATARRMAEDRPPVMDVLERLNGRIETFPVTLHITWEASFSPALEGVKQFVDRFGQYLISPDEYLRLHAK